MRTTAGALAFAALASVVAVACQPPDGTASLGARVNPQNTGVSTSHVPVDAGILWRKEFGRDAGVGTPVILGDLVITPVSRARIVEVDGQTRLDRDALVVAHDRLTGREVWSRTEPDLESAIHLSAGNGRVVAASGFTLLAFDARTGRPLWRAERPVEGTHGPTVAGDHVYVVGLATGNGAISAYDARTGALEWHHEVELSNGSGSPAVTADRVFFGSPCGVTEASARRDGARAWYFASPCYGGGYLTTVAANGRVYVVREGADPEGFILDQASGRQLGTFRSATTPIVTATDLVISVNGDLEKRSLDAKALRWRHVFFEATGMPVLAGDALWVVVDGHTNGTSCAEDGGALVGLRFSDGREQSRVPLGPYCNQGNATQTAPASANHVIAVPYRNQLVVIG